MQRIETVSDLRSVRHQWRMEGKKVAFVPTMGNLHNGHLQLVRQAKQHADVVIVSIFVNPMQFGENEDLDAYPRTLEADCAHLEQNGVAAVFLPSVTEMYPRGLAAQTFVEVPGISDVLCGASRPGHFRGVATIVSKLFNMVQPELAFFGQKDYQQLQVIKLMARDLSMDIDIRGVPTERENSGLALSSRNGYLSEAQKALAPTVYATLTAMSEAIKAGRTDYSELCDAFNEQLSDAGFKPDYLHVRNADTLEPATPSDSKVVILIAAYLGTTRLIDNLVVER